MAAIAGNLGLNVPGFLWHSANFLVLLGLLWLVLYKPVTRMLNEREQRIRESLERAEEIRRQAEQSEADRQALLAETRREAEAIRHRADEQAKRILADAEARTQEQTTQMLARAQADIVLSREQMLAEVRGQLADLIVSAVDRVTRQAIDAQGQRALVQQFLADQSGPLTTPSRN